MGGKISVLLLALSLGTVSPAWAQNSGSGQPDELQIIEFDYDNQNNPPAVNLPPTLQTPPAPPATATSQTPAPVLAPADPPAAKTAPAIKVEPVSAPPTKPAKALQPAKTATPTQPQKQEKVITIVGEPETPAAAGGAGPKPAGSASSDEELLDSLFGSADQAPGGDVPAKKPGGTAAAPAGAKPAFTGPVTPAGNKVDAPKKAGPLTPAVSPLRPPVSSAPPSVKVERSSEPGSITVERRSVGKSKVIVRTSRSPEGREVRFFHDEAAIVGDFNPHRRAVINPKTRPIPPAAASYPDVRGLGWTDFRNWELGTYYWSLVHAGYSKPLEFVTSRPIPINKAGLPAGSPQPKNYW